MKMCQGSWCIALAAGAVGFGSALMLGAGEPDKNMKPHSKPAGKDMSHAQPMPEMTEAQKKEMEAWMAAGTPGKMHEKLGFFAGNWNAEVTSHHDGQTDVTKGSMKSEPMYDGRFIMSKFEGSMMGMPFQGTAIMGFNNVTQEFEQFWIDSMMTSMALNTGTIDTAGKKMTLTGDYECPMDHKQKSSRWVTTITGPDSYTMELYYPNPEGKEELVMVNSYKRMK